MTAGGTRPASFWLGLISPGSAVHPTLRLWRPLQVWPSGAVSHMILPHSLLQVRWDKFPMAGEPHSRVGFWYPQLVNMQ